MSKRAEELWEKHCIKHRGGGQTLLYDGFLAAIREYGEYVRNRDAEVCREYPRRDPAEDGNGYWAAENCAAAITKEPMP